VWYFPRSFDHIAAPSQAFESLWARFQTFSVELTQDFLHLVTSIRTPNPADFLRLFVVSAVWGASFICNNIALIDFSPLAITSWRVVLAALVILVICRKMKLSIPLDRKSLGLFTIIGILNSIVPFTLIGWGQQSVNSAVTALLIATSPFVTLILSHFMTSDDRFTTNRLIGLVVGFSGVAVLFGHGIVIAGNSAAGMLAIILASACYALSSLLIRKLAHLRSMVIVAGSLLISGVVLLPVLLWQFPPWEQQASSSSVFALLFLAIFPTATAYVLRAQIVRLNGAVFMSNAGYLIPLFATLWAWLFLSEIPSAIMWVAMLLIFIGIFIGQRPGRQKTPAVQEPYNRV